MVGNELMSIVGPLFIVVFDGPNLFLKNENFEFLIHLIQKVTNLVTKIS